MFRDSANRKLNKQMMVQMYQIFTEIYRELNKQRIVQMHPRFTNFYAFLMVSNGRKGFTL